MTFGRICFSKRLVTVVLALTLTGCAIGEVFKTAKNKIPALNSDKGRIFVYRTLNPLAIFKPRKFTLNGKDIADTFGSTILYHDVTPGKYEVNYNNRRDKLLIKVPAGGIVYLKYSLVDDSVAIGNTAVTLMEKKVAEKETNESGIFLIETKIRYPKDGSVAP
jgi:hypothetical protein